MKNKICFIIPYFGSFPLYFDLFLKSCEYNKEFNWIIFTDNKEDYDYPQNVKKIELTFKEFNSIIQSKFDFEISLNTPKKLCDYKPTYGYIFEEYLKGYDFWGYCDIDLIFGDLSKFITDEILDNYDRLFSLGHLSLYRNKNNINKMFMQKINNKSKYKEVYQSDNMFVFDEWYEDSVNYIFLDNDINIYSKDVVADIFAYNYSFKLVYFDIEKMKWKEDYIDNSIFKYYGGKVIRIWKDKNLIREKEYMYIHIQKRKMKNKIKDKSNNNYYIVPNKFIQFEREREIDNIIKYKLVTFFDYKKINKNLESLKEKTKIKIKKFLKL